MIAILSYSSKDWNLAFTMASLLYEKTNVPMDKFYLYKSQFAPEPGDDLQRIVGRVLEPRFEEKGYPVGPNSMFANLCRVMEDEGWKEPVMLLEPDAFPTTPDWYDRVKKAHEDTKHLASGSFVGWIEPKHYNGNLVMDPRCVKLNPSLKHVTYEAWDCFHADFFENVGADNPEISNPRRTLPYYPTKWYFRDGKQEAGQHVPAWIHGCQNFQAAERISTWEDAKR